MSQAQIDNARKYVARVKEMYGNDSRQYRGFLEALREYRSRQLEPLDVIDRIAQLFKGDRSLIIGFNAFLPEEYHIYTGRAVQTPPRGNSAQQRSEEEDESKPSGDAVPRPPKKKPKSGLKAKPLEDQPDADRPSSNPKKHKRKLKIPSSHNPDKFTPPSPAPRPLKRQAQSLVGQNVLKPNTKIIMSALGSNDEGKKIEVSDVINCCLCRGSRDETEKDETVLMCEQKGCDVEFHLGCLYHYYPHIERPKNGEGVPEGELYCSECHVMGSASVLENYFDKVESERSNYSCQREFVGFLLANHMKDYPDANSRKTPQDRTTSQNVEYLPPPRSELWYAHDLVEQALEGSESVSDIERTGELLVGKSVRIYNSLDNDYHVGRIVDWRTSTVYSSIYGNAGPPVSEDNTVELNDLEFYGNGPLSTSEFLIRFPPGLQGRKKEVTRWVHLEEHSLAVGVCLIEGRTTSVKSSKTIEDWKPALVIARSALELVAVRQFLNEDENGNLFAEMITEGSNRKPHLSDRWALASFFGYHGEDQHGLLRLRDEARELSFDETKSNGKGEDEEDVTKPEAVAKGLPPTYRSRFADHSDIPLNLALAEKAEQERCKDWVKLILQKNNHPSALVSANEYGLHLEVDLGGQQIELDRLKMATTIDCCHGKLSRERETIMGFKCEPVSSMAGAISQLHGHYIEEAK